MTALILEASESNVRLYVKSLTMKGIQTVWMPSGETAIQHCRKHAIDILICRVIVDDMSGYEVIAEITKDRSIAVLVISKYPTSLIQSVRGFDRNVPVLQEPFT
jgi:DNA-binding response OmpR family regulator